MVLQLYIILLYAQLLLTSHIESGTTKNVAFWKKSEEYIL